MFDQSTIDRNIIAYMISNPEAYPLYRDFIFNFKVIHTDEFRYILTLLDSAYSENKGVFPRKDEAIHLIDSSAEYSSIMERQAYISTVDEIYGNLDTTFTTLSLLNKHLSEKALLSLSRDMITVASADKAHLITAQLEQLKYKIDEILVLHESNFGIGLMPLEPEVIERRQEYYESEGGEVITTGIKRLDNITRYGGLMEGDLMAIMAPVGRGKSSLVLNMLLSAAKAGHIAIWYVLDNREMELVERVDANLTGIPYDTGRNWDVYLTALKMAAETYPGKFILREFEANTATLPTIKKHIDMVEREYGKVGIIALDSGNLLRHSYNSTNNADNLGHLYADFRSMAKYKKLRVISTVWTNRGGELNATNTLYQIGDSYAIARSTSLFCAINFDSDDPESSAAELAVLKNTTGKPQLILPIIFDKSTMRIYDDYSRAPRFMKPQDKKKFKGSEQSIIGEDNMPQNVVTAVDYTPYSRAANKEGTIFNKRGGGQ